MIHQHDMTGVILAGGKSRRMGKDKRLILFNKNTILEHIILLFKNLFREVLVVYGQDNSLITQQEVCVVEDIYPHCGSMGGLFTGLKYSPHTHIFAVGCDMPFLSEPLIRWMCQEGLQSDVCIPKIEDTFHPLHAVYSKNCLPFLKQHILDNNLKIQTLMKENNLKKRIIVEEEIRQVDPNLYSLINLNTPQDLQRAEELAKVLFEGKP